MARAAKVGAEEAKMMTMMMMTMTEDCCSRKVERVDLEDLEDLEEREVQADQESLACFSALPNTTARTEASTWPKQSGTSSPAFSLAAS